MPLSVNNVNLTISDVKPVLDILEGQLLKSSLRKVPTLICLMLLRVWISHFQVF